MATSASYNFTVTRDDIIQFALRKLTVLKRGQTLSADDTSEAAFALNLIVQQLRERSDGTASLKMWQRKRLKLLFADTQTKYSIPGDHIMETSELVTTTLTATATSTTSLTVASITGIANADYAGIVEDGNTITWTTVSGAPSGSTVTLASAVTLASSGNTCYFYTTPAVQPVNILSANLVDVNGYESAIGKFEIGDYWQLADKAAAGVPGSVYVERQRDTMDLYFDQAINDVKNWTVNLLVQYPIEDFDATADNPDFPKQWYRALGYALAVDLAPEYGVPLGDLGVLASQAFTIAGGSDPETTDLFFESGT